MNKKQKKKLKSIIISAILLIVVTIVIKLINSAIDISSLTNRILATVLYLIPYLAIGGSVLIKAAKNIRNGQIFDENFLMVIATIGAFCLGEYMEAAAVMLFYQVGQLFENIAVNKSRTAITSLVNLRPDYANIEKNGDIEKVDPYDVAVDDVIVVLAGEKIPLDGIIIDGESYINTSALTGESVPRKVNTGDAILSGCINEQGILRIKVTKEFDDSTVAKILDLVENASTQKSRSEGFITRFAKYYTPLVVIGAVFVALIPPLFLSQSFAVWVERALILLFISCPCALVISVPLGFFGGIGAASKYGILVKGSNYLEAIAAVDTIVFDKTGTLTEGVFRVNKIVPLDNLDEEGLLELAAYAECYSNHPIAKSIKDAFVNNGGNIDKEKIEDVNEIAGKGICMTMKSRIYYAGNAKLLTENNIKLPSMINNKAGTLVYVASNDKCLGYILISDVIKENTKPAIKKLKEIGVPKTVMLTGDIRDNADAVAAEIGITDVFSELMPGEKLEKLEELINSKNKSGKIAFVGDGINDAPSLTRADIGIAMGAMGQDAAIEAADIVLMDDNPMKIATVSLIGRKTLAIVKQNIVFALGIKLLAMILGIMGITGMLFAVFADVGVSVLAILNSIRMLKFKHTY